MCDIQKKKTWLPIQHTYTHLYTYYDILILSFYQRATTKIYSRDNVFWFHWKKRKNLFSVNSSRTNSHEGERRWTNQSFLKEKTNGIWKRIHDQVWPCQTGNEAQMSWGSNMVVHVYKMFSKARQDTHTQRVCHLWRLHTTCCVASITPVDFFPVDMRGDREKVKIL
jgi:hypothetical protein